MKLKGYAPIKQDFWQGRVDDENDRDSYRMHQIIQVFDLTCIDKLEIEESKLRICFLGFGCDAGIVRNLGRDGAQQGPEYIRKEFANLPVTFGDDILLYDAGDIYCNDDSMEDAQAHLSIAIDILLKRGFFPIVLGGGHELAFGHYNGIVNYLDDRSKGSSLGIVNFDAHFDLRPYKEQASSGTMFSQIADKCKASSRDFSYMCLGIQTSANTISLFKKADALNVEYVLAKDMIESNYLQISNHLRHFINKQSHIYITICSDVFNSAFAPGVSSLQPFGLNPEVVLVFLKEILKTKKTVSIDIAEVSPRFDQDKRTAKLSAVIIYSIINSLYENITKRNRSDFEAFS